MTNISADKDDVYYSKDLSTWSGKNLTIESQCISYSFSEYTLQDKKQLNFSCAAADASVMMSEHNDFCQYYLDSYSENFSLPCTVLNLKR